MSDNPIEKKPIRVLQIIGIVCGGGVEAVIMNYYRHIDRSKVQFDFVVDGFEKTGLDDEIESLGGKIYHITPYKNNIFRYMNEIKKIVHDNHYEIVHSNMNTLSVFSLFAAWRGGASVRILHNHSTAVFSEGLRSVMKYILRPFAPLFANVCVACSEYAGEWMYGKKKMSDGSVTVFRNAIAVGDFYYDGGVRKQLRRELHIADDALVIGHVGRFMYQKNHSFLIDVFKEIQNKVENSVLLLVGDGPLKTDVMNKIEKLNIVDKVRFLGIRRDVYKWYNVMDVFVLPSRYEGLGVVGVEAQANGLYCFFSNEIPLECKCSSYVKYLSLQENPEVWAKQILNVDCHRHSSKSIHDFDIKEAAKKMERFYLEKLEI